MTNKFKSLRSSVFETDKPTTRKQPFRPNISFPLERPADFVDRRQGPEALSSHAQELVTSGWGRVESPLMSPTYSTAPSSPYRRSSFSSPASSRASSATPRTSYDSGDDFLGDVASSVSGKKVSFILAAKVIPHQHRGSTASLASSLYAEEGVLPPPIEDDEHIRSRIGKNRFSAAEYIREIEGTPMIIVDGKLYL